MNNIQEKDWAEDDWSGHTGMESDSCYCASLIVDEGKSAEKDVSSAKPIQQPFAMHYEFIRRGEVEIVFTLNDSTLPVRALFFTDPLLDLSETALQLHEGARQASVEFIGNGGERQLVLERGQAKELAVEIRRFEKGANSGQNQRDTYTVDFKGNTTVDAYCRQVLRVLRRIDQEIGVEQYKTKWVNADFPSESYWRLNMALDSLR